MAVRRDPVARDLGRQRRARHRLGLQRRADLIEHDVERRDQHRAHRARRAGVATRADRSSWRGAAHRQRGPAVARTGDRAQRPAVRRQRGDRSRRRSAAGAMSKGLSVSVEQQRGILRSARAWPADRRARSCRPTPPAPPRAASTACRPAPCAASAFGGEHVDRVGRAQSGSRIRSASARIAGPFGLRRWSGLKSKRTNGSSAMLASHRHAERPEHAPCDARASQRSSGASSREADLAAAARRA